MAIKPRRVGAFPPPKNDLEFGEKYTHSLLVVARQDKGKHQSEHSNKITFWFIINIHDNMHSFMFYMQSIFYKATHFINTMFGLNIIFK